MRSGMYSVSICLLCEGLVDLVLGNALYFAKTSDPPLYQRIVDKLSAACRSGFQKLRQMEELYEQNKTLFVNFCQSTTTIPLLLFLSANQGLPTKEAAKNSLMQTFDIRSDDQWAPFIQSYAQYLSRSMFYGSSGFSCALRLLENEFRKSPHEKKVAETLQETISSAYFLNYDKNILLRQIVALFESETRHTASQIIPDIIKFYEMSAREKTPPYMLDVAQNQLQSILSLLLDISPFINLYGNAYKPVAATEDRNIFFYHKSRLLITILQAHDRSANKKELDIHLKSFLTYFSDFQPELDQVASLEAANRRYSLKPELRSKLYPTYFLRNLSFRKDRLDVLIDQHPREMVLFFGSDRELKVYQIKFMKAVRNEVLADVKLVQSLLDCCIDANTKQFLISYQQLPQLLHLFIIIFTMLKDLQAGALESEYQPEVRAIKDLLFKDSLIDESLTKLISKIKVQILSKSTMPDRILMRYLEFVQKWFKYLKAKGL